MTCVLPFTNSSPLCILPSLNLGAIHGEMELTHHNFTNSTCWSTDTIKHSWTCNKTESNHLQHQFPMRCEFEHEAEFEGHHGINGQVIYPFICLAISLILDSFAGWIGKRTGIVFPVTVLMLLFSTFITIFLHIMKSDDDVGSLLIQYTWSSMSPHSIMFAVLPILIFEGAFRIEAHEFFKFFILILYYAVFSFLIASSMTAVAMFSFENWWRESPLTAFIGVIVLGVCIDGSSIVEWNWFVCFIFGFMISATDPVAVIALLHDLGAPHELSLLTEGESLLNDGAAIIFYNIFIKIVHARHGVAMELEQEIMLQIGGVLLSILIGFLSASATAWLLGSTFRNSIKERGIIFSAVYLTYIICESTKGSGVLGLVFLGVCLNQHKDKLSEEAAKDNLKTWALLAYWANGIVFITTGVIIGQTLFAHKSPHYQFDLLMIFAVFGVILVVRFVVVLSSFFVFRLKCFNYPISKEFIVVLWWGGLRGAVALLLAMQLRDDKILDPLIIGERVVVYVGGVVLLSLALCATTTGPLIKRLKLDRVSKYRTKLVDSIVQKLLDERNVSMQTIRQNTPELADANWEVFVKRTTIYSPYAPKPKRNTVLRDFRISFGPVRSSREESVVENDSQDVTQSTEKSPNSKKISTQKKPIPIGKRKPAESRTSTLTVATIRHSDSNFDDMGSDSIDQLSREEMAHSVYRRMEAHLRHMNRRGALTEDALQFLIHSLREAHDLHKFDVKSVLQHWRTRPFWIRLNSSIQSCWRPFEDNLYASKRLVYWFLGDRTINRAYDVMSLVSFCFTVLHITCVTLAVTSTVDRPSNNLQLYEFMKSVVCLLFATEYAIRIWLKGLHDWFSSRLFWCITETALLIFYIFDIIARMYTFQKCHQHHVPPITYFDHPRFIEIPACQILTYVEYFVVIRFFRLIWLIYILLRLMVFGLQQRIHHNLATVLIALNALCMAFEYLNRNMPSKVLYNRHMRKYIDELLLLNKAKKKECLFEMAKLQAENPEVAVGMKTQCAALQFLQSADTSVQNMDDAGELEPTDANLLQEIIRTEMINTLNMPLMLQPLPFKTALRYVPCFGELAPEFINLVKPIRQKFLEGEIIMRQHSMPQGFVYLHKGTTVFRKWDATRQNVVFEITLYAGQVIGEVGVLFDEPRSGDIVAWTNCTLYKFPIDQAKEALIKMPKLRLNLIQNYCVHRGADYLRRLQKYRAWTDLRIANLLMHGTVHDLVDTDTYRSLDLNACDRILLMRGEVVDSQNRRFNASNGPVEVPDTFRNGHRSQHCLIFAVPKDTALPGTLALMATPEALQLAELKDDLTQSSHSDEKDAKSIGKENSTSMNETVSTASKTQELK